MHVLTGAGYSLAELTEVCSRTHTQIRTHAHKYNDKHSVHTHANTNERGGNLQLAPINARIRNSALCLHYRDSPCVRVFVYGFCIEFSPNMPGLFQVEPFLSLKQLARNLRQ